MGLVETEGLILRTYSLSDADKIVVALTEGDGLVRGVAKGAKRLKSRFGSGLEPFSIVKLSYLRKEERELVTLTDVELERSYFSIASEPMFLEAFSYAADLLQSFAPPHDPNERLYRMSKICLETAAADRETIPAVIVYFEIWLLKLGGFLPSWAQCAECGREPGQTETVSLEADFNIVCGRCSARGRVSDVSSELRRAYEGAQRTGPVRFTEDIREKDEITRELSSILRRMIARILNREVKGSEGAA